MSDTRELILDRARELFGHYGYVKTNMGDIAQECGMATSNLYRYFKNKHAIGHAVVNRFFLDERLNVDQLMVRPTDSIERRLRDVVTSEVMHTVDHLRSNPKIVELAEMICDSDEGIALVNHHVEARERLMAELIAEGVRRGEFNVVDVDRAARALKMGVKFFVVPFAIARHGLDRVEEDLALTLDMLCAGLRNRGA